MTIILPDHRLIRFDNIDSTNEEAKRLVEAGQGEAALIVAAEQTAGRGRRGRQWQSPVGNIYATWLEPLNETLMQAANRGFMLSLSVAEAVDELLDGKANVGVKWPNDVLVDEAKISGILLEIAYDPADAPWLISGFGVNVMHKPTGTPYPATSVASHIDTTVDDVLQRIAARYTYWGREYAAHGFAPIHAAWLARAVRLGQQINVNLPNGEQLTGVFETLQQDGSLLLTVDGTAREIQAGDIYFNRNAA